MVSSYFFSADESKIDPVLVHKWLSEESYWAKGRTRELQAKAMAGSRNFGVYRTGTEQQLAYARVITDGATFAWLCDVFVDPSERGNGIGVALIAGVTGEFEPLNLKRMLLATSDAHGLYAKFGFEPIDESIKWMQLTAKQA